MNNRKRLRKILVYFLMLVLSATILYCLTEGRSFTSTMAFRRQEKINLIGPAEIIATIDFPHGGYDHMMIGESEYGYTFYEWYDHSGWDDGVMTYIPRQKGATIHCTYYQYGSAEYTQDWLPIFAFADHPGAVSAQLTLTTSQNGETISYPLEADRSEEGYFLFVWKTMGIRGNDFRLIQQLIANQHREYILDGSATATLTLFDKNGNALNTYQYA